MKKATLATLAALVLLTFATPSTLLAQSWWQGFANAPQSNAFWEFLQQHPNMYGPLQKNPYQIYDPKWRTQNPEFQRYINNNPGWWNSVVANGSQYYSGRFNRFLKNHQKIARDLQRNPNLIYDPNYRAQHPDLNRFLANHPNVWQSIKNQRYVYSPNGGWGAYDNSGQWRNSPWWNENGAWNRQNQWRDRDWWKKNDPKWVRQNRPTWYENPAGHVPPGQMKKQYRHGHGHDD